MSSKRNVHVNFNIEGSQVEKIDKSTSSLAMMREKNHSTDNSFIHITPDKIVNPHASFSYRLKVSPSYVEKKQIAKKPVVRQSYSNTLNFSKIVQGETPEKLSSHAHNRDFQQLSTI